MAQFTSSAAKCSHVFLWKDKELQSWIQTMSSACCNPCSPSHFGMGAVPVPGLPAAAGQHIQNHLRNLLLLTQHHPGHPRSSCTQRAPGSRLQTWLGEHKTPRDVSGHQVKQISVLYPKDQLKRGQWENSVPSPVLSFPPGKAGSQKKLIRRDNNVPKCCVNILKLNIYSKVN